MARTRRFKWPAPGHCRVCGCTDAQACPDGCWWVDADETVCSSCGGSKADLTYTVRFIVALARKYGRAADVLKASTAMAREALTRMRKRHPKEKNR